MDPDQNQYADDVVVRLLELCEKTFGDYFLNYKQGLPSTPFTDADYPACVVQKMTGSYDLDATSQDAENEKVVIMLFSNKADDMGGANDPGITTLRRLQNMVEGKIVSANNPGWFEYAPNTLMYTIRKNLTLSQTVIKSAVETSYDMHPRVSQDGTPINGIAMALITMSSTEKIIVPNRS